MSEKGSATHIEKIAVEESRIAVKDEGLAYGGEDKLPPPPTLSKEQEAALYRKIDWRLMPILSLMYLCSFLDRGNIGEWCLLR